MIHMTASEYTTVTSFRIRQGRQRQMKMSKFIHLVFSLALVLGTNGTPIIAEDNYDRTAELDGSNYVLKWRIRSGLIEMETRVRTNGYVGLGFSRHGNMVHADIVLAGFRNGVPYIEDRHSERPGTPLMDEQQDWKLISGRYDAGFTILRMSRMLRACDATDQDLTKPYRIPIIWAYSNSSKIDYHGPVNRGTVGINLHHEDEKKYHLSKDAFSVDFRMDNFPIASRETQLVCKWMNVSHFLKTKHHIIAMEVLVDQLNRKMVHHMLLFTCNISVEEASVRRQGYCDGGKGIAFPEPIEHICKGYIAMWAQGGANITYADNIGFPIADGSFNTLLLNIHYNNPQHVRDAVDRTGFRLWVTPSLRKNEVGWFEVGMKISKQHILPPGQPEFTTQAWCPHGCLRKASPNGFTIRALTFHGHGLTTQIRLRHVRKGIELPPVYVDAAYEARHHFLFDINPPRKVLPGDDLLLECTYNSITRSNLTLGGSAWKNEMCQAYMLVSPVTTFPLCISVPTFGTLGKFVNSTEPDLIFKSLGLTNWSIPENVEAFKRTLRTGKIEYTCQEDSHAPVIRTPYYIPDRPCVSYLDNTDTYSDTGANYLLGILQDQLVWLIPAAIIIFILIIFTLARLVKLNASQLFMNHKYALLSTKSNDD